MQWDLWNPWARFHEIHSTHPLVARRLEALADEAAALGQEPAVVFDRRQPESFWDEFFVDLVGAGLVTSAVMVAGLPAGLRFLCSAAGPMIERDLCLTGRSPKPPTARARP